MLTFHDKIVVGRKEVVTFPEFNIEKIDVKIDSGAYSSSIDCSHVEEVFVDGKKKLEVVFLHPHHNQYSGIKYYFEHYDKKKVTSSSGNAQIRFILTFKVLFFNQVITTQFTLTNRKGMRNSVLIGRKMLNKRFIIDTSKKYLSLNY